MNQTAGSSSKLKYFFMSLLFSTLVLPSLIYGSIYIETILVNLFVKPSYTADGYHSLSYTDSVQNFFLISQMLKLFIFPVLIFGLMYLFNKTILKNVVLSTGTKIGLSLLSLGVGFLFLMVYWLSFL